MNKESGFTLIETVLMLFIAGTLILLPVLSIDKIIENIQIDLFFRELSSNITMMQNHTLLTDQRTTISFVSSDVDTIRFEVNGYSDHPLNRDLQLDSPYYNLTSKGIKTFSFVRHTGNINRSNTIGFDTTQGRYNLTYLLGSGRFDFKKVEK